MRDAREMLQARKSKIRGMAIPDPRRIHTSGLLLLYLNAMKRPRQVVENNPIDIRRTNNFRGNVLAYLLRIGLPAFEGFGSA